MCPYSPQIHGYVRTLLHNMELDFCKIAESAIVNRYKFLSNNPQVKTQFQASGYTGCLVVIASLYCVERFLACVMKRKTFRYLAREGSSVKPDDC